MPKQLDYFIQYAQRIDAEDGTPPRSTEELTRLYNGQPLQASGNQELSNDCHSPEDGRFCGDSGHGHKNPSDIYEAVYMAGERFGGDLSGGTRHYQDLQDAATRIAAGKDVGNKLNTRSGKELADQDAALLMAALPASSKNEGPLYRGTAPDEGSPYDPDSKGPRELSPGDEISLPLTAVTSDEQVAKDRVYNRGAIYEFPAGSTPFIPIQGIVGGLKEGITGGKFRVKAVDYESNLDGVTETQRVILEHIADHGSEARKQMRQNGWTFGPDLSLQASGLEEFGKRKGNFEALRRWYTSGGGADRINWGTKGDFTRCMKLVSKYLPPDQLGGFCQNRHMEIYGESNAARDTREDKKKALAARLELSNDCHDAATGRFCETPGPTSGFRSADDARISPTLQEIGKQTELGDTNYEWSQSLTNDEEDALQGYTSQDYKYINRRLDDPHAYNPEVDYADEQIERIDSALAKAPTMTTPIITYRGVEFPGMSQEQVSSYIENTYAPGQEISLSKGGYQSTSLNVEAPLDHSLTEKNNGLIFEVQARRGAYLAGVGRFDDEQEFLIDRKARFRVVSIQRDVTFIKGEDMNETVRPYVIQVEQIL